jgi:hypothetical protein
MKPWQLMLTSVIAWLALAVFGLRWVLAPYWWEAMPRLGVPRTIAALRADFPIHLAPFPEAAPSPPSDEEMEGDGEEDLVRGWIWRETLRRFLLGFSLWMASGWFVHWFTSRIIYGPQRWRGHRQ